QTLMVLLIGGTVLLYWGTTQELYPVSKAWRVAFFEILSAISTCGFATVSYGNWRVFGWFLMTLLMIVGGGTG
ncbi:MAG: hypothetical protein KDE51_28205, partial [Anaerolineales bacterium]|nr:hypothetical protein [Anaerolineales bacterium]